MNADGSDVRCIARDEFNYYARPVGNFPHNQPTDPLYQSF